MIERCPESLPADPPLDAPLLYLSSTDAGWQGLVAEAFHEPMELEGWIAPATTDISLIVFAGGAMRVAQRLPQGAWIERTLGQGDLILQPGAGTSAEVRWKSLSATPTQTLHLHLNRALFARAAAEATGADPARLAILGRSGFQDPLLAQIGFALWRELEQGAPSGAIYAETAAQFLAMHLVRDYTAHGGVKDPAQRLTPQQLNRLADFVQAHMAHDLSLAALAEQTGFSPYHFARLFRRTTGASPHQWLLQQRVAQAQRLLAERDVPLAQVALACGFANQSHFTQTFKRHLGITPRAYRQDRASRAGF